MERLPGEPKGMNEGGIIRGRAGIIMPQKNAFDFVVRPKTDENCGESKQADPKGGAANVRKVMEAMKKANRASYTNKRLQIVKIDC